MRSARTSNAVSRPGSTFIRGITISICSHGGGWPGDGRGRRPEFRFWRRSAWSRPFGAKPMCRLRYLDALHERPRELVTADHLAVLRPFIECVYRAVDSDESL